MTIQEFIEKAVAGGWNPYSYEFEGGDTAKVDAILNDYEWPIRLHFLDPKAWKAVGKVEGWKDAVPYDCCFHEREEWLENMHRMIDALAEGRSIEQFLETL